MKMGNSGGRRNQRGLLPSMGRTTGLRGKQPRGRIKNHGSHHTGDCVSTREAQLRSEAFDKPANPGLGDSHSHGLPPRRSPAERLLFFWLRWALLLPEGVLWLRREQAGLWLWSAGFSLLRLPCLSTGSRVRGLRFAVNGLSCPKACGVFPEQGSNPSPLLWRRVLKVWTTGEPCTEHPAGTVALSLMAARGRKNHHLSDMLRH